MLIFPSNLITSVTSRNNYFSLNLYPSYSDLMFQSSSCLLAIRSGLDSRIEGQRDDLFLSTNYYFEVEFSIEFCTFVFSRNMKVCQCSSEHKLSNMVMSQMNQAANALFCLFSVYFWIIIIVFYTVVKLLIWNHGRNWWQWLCMSVVLVNLQS